jgi:putative phosphoribosyl transferase
MYFHSRAEAGQKLAAELVNYIPENCVVVALGRGAVLVGEPIAATLHSKLTLLIAEHVRLPGESMTFGTVTQDGSFTYNDQFSSGEIDEYYSEFHGYIDDQKREKFQKINRLLGGSGPMEVDLLRDKVLILVADGLKTGARLHAAKEFLKPIRTKRLIVVSPVASVQAVDAMHMLADELHCLSVTPNYISTNHYYDDNDVPTVEATLERIKNIT